MATDAEKIQRIRELHSPVERSEGKTWMGAPQHAPNTVPCAGCSTGDPYLDEPWPCETRKICDEDNGVQK